MSIQINAQGVDRAIAKMQSVLESLGSKEAGKAIANALNQSLAQGRKEASRLARRAYTAPVKKLFDNIKIERARASNLEGTLNLAGSRGISLIHFNAQPNFPQPPAARPASGITAQIKTKGQRKARFGKNGGSKSFIMKKKQGGFGVFVRHGKSKYEMLLGPTPIQYLQRKDAQAAIKEKVEESFAPRLEQEIDKLLAASFGR